MKSKLLICVVPLCLMIAQFPQALAAQRSSVSHKQARYKVEAVDDQETSETTVDKPLGLGLMLGDLTGIAGKYWSNENNAFDGGFSYALNDYAALHVDYLWNVSQMFGMKGRQNKQDSLTSPYFGIGAITYFDTSKGTMAPNQDSIFQRLHSSGIALGARVPIGLEYQPPVVPCGIFGEFAPGAVLIPGMVSFLQAEGGVRFYL